MTSINADALQLQPGDWRFTTSPYEGEADCICSRCAHQIDEDQFALRMYDRQHPDTEYRLCDVCQRRTDLRFPPYHPLLGNGPGAPAYWRDEVSGVMPELIRQWCKGDELNQVQLCLLAHYLGYYVCAPVWGPEADPKIRNLIERLPTLQSRPAIREWLADAMEVGIDPL